MRIRMRSGTTAWVQAAAFLALLAAAGGCSGQPQSSGTRTIEAARTTAAHHARPHAGTRAESLRLAIRLLRRMVLPPGTRRLPARPLPHGLRQPGSIMSATTTIDRYRLFELAISMTRAKDFLAAHPPAGMTVTATGWTGDHNRVTERMVSDTLAKLLPGISAADLTASIVPGSHGRSLLRADVQVIWFPRRSAAERLQAASFRAVRITAWLSGRKVREVKRTFTAKAEIRRLVRLLDGLPASPGGAMHCPAILASYRLTFVPVAARPGAVVSTVGCASDAVTVGGKPQPALADPGQLAGLAGRLLQVRPPWL